MGKIKKQLSEVTIIRPVTILFLIVVHSFAIYTGSWGKPEGISDVKAYFWIGKLAFSSMLEMFVFISGYLFAFQLYDLKKEYTLKKLVYDKFKRLVVPSIVFSTIYMAIFQVDSVSIFKSLYDILNGVAHLWFLPMLFWCFVCTWFLLKIKISDEIKLIILFILSILSFVPLPFRLTNTLYYLFYFYLGIYIFKHKDYIVKNIIFMRSICIILLLFVITFVLFTILRENLQIDSCDNVVYKIFLLSVNNLVKMVYASLGVLSFYYIVMFALKKGYEVSGRIVKLNYICFGIYIIHQFILEFLYYKIGLSELMGSYWLPWVAMLITLISSAGFALVLRATKVGRLLIG